MACVRLGDVFANAMGNLTAAGRGSPRAGRLVDDEPPCVEQGWVAVAAMGCDVDDPAELLAAPSWRSSGRAGSATSNLETKALADAGLAHVQAGRIAEGMALLDEAMALACGPADDATARRKSVCSFFTACYYAADFARAGVVGRACSRQHGLIGSRAGGPNLPVEPLRQRAGGAAGRARALGRGRGGAARAIAADFEAAMPIAGWHPDIALADLRVRQGRFADAEALLLGKDQAIRRCCPTARLHLARGDHDLARAAAQRGLRAVGDDRCGRSSC